MSGGSLVYGTCGLLSRRPEAEPQCQNVSSFHPPLFTEAGGQAFVRPGRALATAVVEEGSSETLVAPHSVGRFAWDSHLPHQRMF